MGNKRSKIAVGLSGGVDSSVAAALLKENECEIIGITMEIFDGLWTTEDSKKNACYGPGEKEDVERAAGVCDRLGIPFSAIDLRKEYREHVIRYFRREYSQGRTPNPCAVCNQKLKFGFLLERARNAGMDFEYFATGHYARIEKRGNRLLLKKAVHQTKDQTYFLYALTSEQLSRTLFPLGGYTKERVREIARSIGLDTADHRDSQDFIAGGDYSVLFEPQEMTSGDIVDEGGHVLGRHRGIIHYTVGQRRGLGISSRRALYVLRIDAENNRIVVGDRGGLLSQGLIAKDLNLLAIDRLDRPHKVRAKIRLTHKEAEATVMPYEGDKAKILFDQPQMSITPGQSVVIYSGDLVFGGGTIERAI